MKMKHRSPDYILLAAIMSLICIGVVMVYSASTSLSYAMVGHEWHFIIRQILWTVLGTVALYVASRINYRKWQQLAGLGLVCTVILLLFVWMPGIGVTIQGSSRWINLGVVRVQPSEVAKVTLMIWLADRLARRPGRLTSFIRGTLPLLAVAGLIGSLILLQPDLGTAVAIILVFGLVLFVAGLPMTQTIALVGVGGVVLAQLIRMAPYRFERYMAFLDPWKDPLDTGYQIIQSLYAIGTGGLFGRGFGGGQQKRFFLPEPHNDFIFSTLAEELGFLGGALLIFLFAVLAVRGMRVALRAPDRFGSLLATGITSMVISQAMINIAVVTASVPVTGITLPLVSYGGSSLLIIMGSLGILLNVSKHISE
ncbi:MAG: putative lipid II flippase FtsW [Selenomonadales bacterium]|jgi:cell division protein FtsW|nr:putative lipid II flippase FtsW [Selenomonadales bacterium]